MLNLCSGMTQRSAAPAVWAAWRCSQRNNDFESKAFVGPAEVQCCGQLNGAGNAGAESDAVIGTGDVVVHGLGNGHHVDAFLVKHAVAERVIAAWDHIVHAKPFDFEDFGSESFSRRRIAI